MVALAAPFRTQAQPHICAKQNASLASFPPANYTALSGGVTQPFFRGYAAVLAGPALRSTQESRSMLFRGLNGPPGKDDEAGLRSAMTEVLQQSGTLDDRKKVVAECE